MEFILFSVIEVFEWFWMGSLDKNIQLMLEFPKGPFFDQGFELWQQLELAYELESDLQDTIDLGRKWLVDSMVEKLN